MSTTSPSPKIKGPEITRRAFLGGAAASALSGCAPEESKAEKIKRILKDELKITEEPAILYLAFEGCADSGIHNFNNIRQIAKAMTASSPNIKIYHADMGNIPDLAGTRLSKPLLESLTNKDSSIPGTAISAGSRALENLTTIAERMQQLGFIVNAAEPTNHGNQMILIGKDLSILSTQTSSAPNTTIEAFKKALATPQEIAR